MLCYVIMLCYVMLCDPYLRESPFDYVKPHALVSWRCHTNDSGGPIKRCRGNAKIVHIIQVKWNGMNQRSL